MVKRWEYRGEKAWRGEEGVVVAVEEVGKDEPRLFGRSWEVIHAKPDRAVNGTSLRSSFLGSSPRRCTPSPPSSPPPIAMANALYNVYRLAGPVAAGAILWNASIYDVRGGTRAVIFDRLSGVQEAVVNEGTHFLVPWLQRAIVYDVRTKPRNISTTTGSKDLQMVSLTLRVLHRPEVPKLPQIYQVRAKQPILDSK